MTRTPKDRTEIATAVDSKVDPPNGAAGFEFGMNVDSAESVCTKAGFDWSMLDKKHGQCSGTPVSTSFAAVPRLRFCSGALCVIQLDIEREKTTELGTVFTDLYGAVQAKYGPKVAGSLTILPDCKKGDFRACIAREDARIDLKWVWPSGESIILFSGESRIGPAMEPGLYLYYATSRPKGQAKGL